MQTGPAKKDPYIGDRLAATEMPGPAIYRQIVTDRRIVIPLSEIHYVRRPEILPLTLDY